MSTLMLINSHSGHSTVLLGTATTVQASGKSPAVFVGVHCADIVVVAAG